MSDELLKHYAGASAEGAGYTVEEETVVEDGLAAGAAAAAEETSAHWGSSPEAEAALADIAAGAGRTSAAAATDAPTDASADVAADAKAPGLVDRIKGIFGG